MAVLPAWLSWWCSGDHTRLVMGGRGFKSRSGQIFFQTFIQLNMIIWGVHCQGFSPTLSLSIYIYIYIYLNEDCLTNGDAAWKKDPKDTTRLHSKIVVCVERVNSELLP